MKVTEGRGRGGAARGQGCRRSPAPSLSVCLGLRLDRLKLMCELGNVVMNQIYEARVEAMAVKKPGPSCSR